MFTRLKNKSIKRNDLVCAIVQYMTLEQAKEILALMPVCFESLSPIEEAATIVWKQYHKQTR